MDRKPQIGSPPHPTAVIPVVSTMPADLLTPLAVYLKLAGNGRDSFLLESVEGGESLARYSFIGVDPEFTITGNSRTTHIFRGDLETEADVPVIEYLRDHFAKFRMEVGDGLPGFAGGAIGILDFSAAAWFEPSLRPMVPESPVEGAFMFCRSVVAFDHASQLIKIITLVFAEEADGGMEVLKTEARARNERIARVLEFDPLVLPEPPQPPVSDPVTVSNFSKADFEAAVRDVKENIAAGDAYQVVISQCFTRETAASAIAIYRAVRSLNPSPYMFLVRMNGREIIGASPEMLVRCRDGQLEYRPIAGTRKRGRDGAEDERLAEELKADKKEVAEHLMLVDLGRNDLGRVAEFGSVKVDGLMNVEKYSHVQHLVSYLYARLRPGLDRFDALAACFPAGTVSGAPKMRAIEIISRLEPTPRGMYAGSVGYFDYSGNMDTCIAIRTMELKDGIARIQAGAGIVADSDPSAEYDETVKKATALMRAIDIAEGRANSATGEIVEKS
ncbi:MAG: anthranilate synthase component I family protein [Pyrinomonadaceae bacterium]